MTTTAQDTELPRQDGFFGHPFGLSTLFAVEFWERFSYYGMKAILLYYMYTQLFDGGLGLPQSLAVSLMSVYGAMVYMTGILGGWVADRLLGSRRSVAVGAVIIMLGHVSLSVPGGGVTALYLSMVLIVVGSGLLKPNVSKIVGDLYSEQDTRRDAGFSILYMAINIGALLAPLVVGELRAAGGFHLGFLAAAAGMLIGLVWFLLTRRALGSAGSTPPNPVTPAERSRLAGIVGAVLAVAALYLVVTGATGLLSADLIVYTIAVLAFALPTGYFVFMVRSPKTTRTEKSRVIAFIPLFITSMFFWIIQEQGASVGAVFAQQRTDLNVLGMHLQPEWFQSIDPLAVVVFAPVYAVLWTKLGRRQPSTPVKFGLGTIIGGVSFLLLALPGLFDGTGVKASPWWLFASFVIVVFGELLVSPVGLSATTKLAPAAFSSQMMGLWFLNDSAAQGVNALITPLYGPDTEVGYFATVGAAAIVVGLALFVITPWIRRMMAGVP